MGTSGEENTNLCPPPLVQKRKMTSFKNEGQILQLAPRPEYTHFQLHAVWIDDG